MHNVTFIFDADSRAVFCEPYERMRLTSIAETGTSSNFYWLMLPMALIGILTATFQSILKSLGHLGFVSQILVSSHRFVA